MLSRSEPTLGQEAPDLLDRSKRGPAFLERLECFVGRFQSDSHVAFGQCRRNEHIVIWMQINAARKRFLGPAVLQTKIGIILKENLRHLPRPRLPERESIVPALLGQPLAKHPAGRLYSFEVVRPFDLVESCNCGSHRDGCKPERAG